MQGRYIVQQINCSKETYQPIPMTKYEHFKRLIFRDNCKFEHYLAILNTINFLRYNSFLENLLVVNWWNTERRIRCLGCDQNNGGGKVAECRWNKIGQELIPVKLGCGPVGGGYALLYFRVFENDQNKLFKNCTRRHEQEAKYSRKPSQNLDCSSESSPRT